MGSAKRSRELHGSPKSLEECNESPSKTGKLRATALRTRFLCPLRGLEEAIELMQLPTMPVKSSTHQETDCDLYRDGILGSAPQVCHSFSHICFAFVMWT